MPSDRPIPYRKFSSQRGALISVEQLWTGDDHLLLVSTSFAMERYRRFYFQDIEALVIRPTRTQRQWIIADAVCLGIFAALSALVLVTAGRDPSSDAVAGAVVLGILAAIFLIALLHQVVKGPSCVTFLQLRTGLERLRAANRVRSSLAMRDRLAALIGAAAEAQAVASATP